MEKTIEFSLLNRSINLADTPYFFLRSMIALSAFSPVTSFTFPFVHSVGSPLNEHEVIRT